MSPEGVRCLNCGGPLAPADAVCTACGEAPPPGQRASLLGDRAEAQAAAGQFAQAARTARPIVDLPLDPATVKLWSRKRALWLQRVGDPRSLEEAEAALRLAVSLDDADDLGHQTWMDLLHRQGRLDEARAEYGRRLERDPEDAVARRHLASLKLMDDLRSAPVPTLDVPARKDGFLMRLARPNAGKMVAAGVGLLSCLWIFFSTVGGHGGAGMPAGAESLGPIVQLAMDPWINALQAVAYAAYLFWGWRIRHGS